MNMLSRRIPLHKPLHYNNPMIPLLCLFSLWISIFAVSTHGFLVPRPTRHVAHHDNTRARNIDTTLFAKSGKRKKKPKGNTICVNRQARRNFEIIDTLEAGVSLKGTEVKSIREGKMNLQDSFVKTNYNGRSCTLMNCHIGKHSMAGSYFQHEERRARPLLLHKEQVRKWRQKTEQSGMTIVPLKAYLNDDNKVKLKIALCRGKNVRDKRNDIKERDGKREMGRITKNFRL
jgi:SsrA-binding protein